MVKCGQRRKRRKREEGATQKDGEDLAGVTPVILRRKRPAVSNAAGKSQIVGRTKRPLNLGMATYLYFPELIQ